MARPRKNRELQWGDDGLYCARDTHGYLYRIKPDLVILHEFGTDTNGFVWFDSAAKMTEWENSGADDGFRYLYLETFTMPEICERWRIPRTVVDRFIVDSWVTDKVTGVRYYAPISVLRKIRAVAVKRGYASPREFINDLLAARSKAKAAQRKAKASATQPNN